MEKERIYYEKTKEKPQVNEEKQEAIGVSAECLAIYDTLQQLLIEIKRGNSKF